MTAEEKKGVIGRRNSRATAYKHGRIHKLCEKEKQPQESQAEESGARMQEAEPAGAVLGDQGEESHKEFEHS